MNEEDKKSPQEEWTLKLISTMIEKIRVLTEGDNKAAALPGCERKDFDTKDIISFIETNYPKAVPKEPWIVIFTTLSGPLYLGKVRQMIYDFGIDFVLALIKFMEFREEYEICTILRDALEEHNAVTGENLPLTI